MLKPSVVFVLLFLYGYHATAQNSSVSVSGQVFDQQTQVPIPFVHILGRRTQSISDSNGNFSILVKKGDTLTFTHINFERYSIQISKVPERTIPIYLKKKENIMQEIIIRDYLPEEELKQEMINHVVKYSAEEVNALYNVEFSTILYKKGYVPEMNSLDNFKNYIKEPQGVTLFSSDPSKGIIKSIKKLTNKTYYSGQLKLNKTDTVLIHSFKFSEE